LAQSDPEQDASEYWTEDRLKTRRWLAAISPGLEELYCSVVKALGIDGLPGRARILGHCVREIRNGLVRSIVGQESSQQFSDTDGIRKLAPLWQQARPKLDTSIQKDGNVPLTADAPPDFPLPMPIIKLISEIVDGHLAVTGTNIDRAVLMFERLQLQPSDNPEQLRVLAKAWWNLGNWFFDKLHNSAETDRELFTDEFKSRVAAFEARLISFAKAPEYAAGLGEIDGILESANRRAS
jgi:hypothetical protein